jgi:CubicO group peptidase (beta-lactamase class C family)
MRYLSWLLFVSACATTQSSLRSDPEALAASIAHVEHGLIPEKRVESHGWSIEERMRHYHTPAVSIAVIHDHRLWWAKAWGVASTTSGKPAGTDTLFQAASISKMVTALAALRQVEAGKLRINADVNQSLQSWKLPENDFTRQRPVTLWQLLTHTAGTNVRTVVGHAPDAPLPTLSQILDGIPPANTPAVRVEHLPGKEFRYSGGGLMIVQQLLVDVSQRPFAEAMQELVLGPLGLLHSSFAVPLPPELMALTATPYLNEEKPAPDRVYPEAAPAGLWTTPSDLARFLVEIQRGLLGQSPHVSVEVARLMTTPVAPIGVPGVWTGLGTFVERHGDAIYFGHDGLNRGFLSVSRATLEGGEGAVVMANGAGAGQLIFEILRSIAVEFRWKGSAGGDWLVPARRP